MHSEWMKIYFLNDKSKHQPWQGSSQESLPLLSEACNQYHARTYQAMFPRRDVVDCIPTGKADSKTRERAKRVGTHMSWQLTVKDKGYKKNKDRLLLGQPLHGCYFTKTFYDPVKKTNITRNVRPVDLVMAYGTGPRDIEEIPVKSEIIYLPIDYCKYLKSKGYFVEEPRPYDFSEQTDPDETQDKVQGLNKPGTQDNNYARLIEQHRFLDLDNDGMREPYIVTLDATSQKVLRISIRYDTDETGKPVDDKQPVEYYTQYNFIENPDGSYGLGFGHLIGPINTAVNKLLRQHIDAATLATIGNTSGFINKQLSVKGGELEIQLGKFIKTESAVDDLQKGIFQFKFQPPGPAAQQMIELLMNRSDRLATVTEAVTGQTDKVMQPTAIMALLEQSQQLFSAVYERTLESWESELSKIYRLNRKFMDPHEYFSVLDVSGKVQPFEVTREDYADDLRVMPVADPQMTTMKQKLTKAQAEWQFIATNPIMMNNPNAGQCLYNASRRFLQAIGTEAIDEILPKPQGMSQPINDPVQENMGALLPMPYMPEPAMGQDHIHHLHVHFGLLNDPQYGATLSDEGRSIINSHIQAHIGMTYGLNEDGLHGMMPQVPMPEMQNGQGTPNPMAQGPNNPMGPQQPQGQVQPGPTAPPVGPGGFVGQTLPNQG